VEAYNLLSCGRELKPFIKMLRGRKMAGKGTILIVDDEFGPREALRIILKSMYNVHTAENGEEALDYIRREEVDLVTLDLKMPGLSGFDVLREIKAFNKDIDVIIVTGLGSLPNAKEAVHYGAGDFISKPFNVAEIITIVSKVFERRNYTARINSLIQQIKNIKTKEEFSFS
jgi:putative two-component system response regulator